MPAVRPPCAMEVRSQFVFYGTWVTDQVVRSGGPIGPARVAVVGGMVREVVEAVVEEEWLWKWSQYSGGRASPAKEVEPGG